MDSSTKPRPPTTISVFLYVPSIESSGSITMATKRALMGTKQAMKSADITTTILATLWFLLVMLSAWVAVVDFTRHADRFRIVTTSVTVQTETTMKALKGINTLLMAKEARSTFSRSLVRTRPRRVLFLPGKNFKPSLLTTYRGATLDSRMTKTITMRTDTLEDVTMFFTWKKK